MGPNTKWIPNTTKSTRRQSGLSSWSRIPTPFRSGFEAMVIKTDLCSYTEYRIYPGKGQKFVAKDGKGQKRRPD